MKSSRPVFRLPDRDSVQDSPHSAYRTAPARLTPIKQSQHLVGHRGVEIVGDVDFAFSKQRRFFRTGAAIGLNRAIGLPAFGDEPVMGSGPKRPDRYWGTCMSQI
jgi:hypothetical protein